MPTEGPKENPDYLGASGPSDPALAEEISEDEVELRRVLIAKGSGDEEWTEQCVHDDPPGRRFPAASMSSKALPVSTKAVA